MAVCDVLCEGIVLEIMDFDSQREKMVDQQIAKRGVSDEKVLSAMRKVPRHEFIPLELQSQAYEDIPVGIGEGQTISQPLMVGLMTQVLDLKSDDCVLEIGTGSGYQTAVLAEIAKKVVTIENIEILSRRAQDILNKLGYQNIEFVTADGSKGIEGSKEAFDAILVTAAAPGELNHLLDQLKVGGRLLAPIGERASQTLTLFEKGKNQVTTQSICQCVFVPLVGEYGYSAT